jgi:hypothetical protein
MIFRDRQLRKCYESNLIKAIDPTDDLRRVRALMAARDLFHMLEGAHSARVHEAIEHLLSPGLRPGLRDWFRRVDAATDSATLEIQGTVESIDRGAA